MLVRLIDLALLVTTEEGYYRLADPVSHAVVSAFGFPDEKDHKKVATLLYKFLENDKIDTPLLELSRVLFRAALWAKDEELAKKTIHLSNDLIKITESYYHARKFRDSINFGFVAVKERPESVTARSYLIRALIQEERFNEAEKEINEIKKHAPFRDVYFLKGFLERRKGNFHLAIDAYKEAEELGRTGVALSRELAFCYYMVQDYKKAMKYVEGALMRDSNNQYVLDLWAQIATQLRDEDTARKALDRLELINKSLFYYHRLSRVELSFGNLPQARTAAIEAVHIANSPPFEVIAQLICCEIEMGNLSEAIDLLNRLDKEHGSIRQDIRIALRCRIENAQCHFSKALDLSEQFKDKSTIFWKKLRRDALFGELRKSALKDKERENYEKELSMLEKELDHINIAYLSPCELDVNLSF
jgi:tetratricopeptide (TPR) repeat protein